MDGWIFSFITACFSSLLWTVLPPVYTLPILLLVATCYFWHPKRKSLVIKCISGFIAGIVWMASVGHWSMTWQLSSSQIQQALFVTGEVTSLNHSNDVSMFNFAVEKIEGDNRNDGQPILRLAWYQPQWKIQQGQKLILKVKLKPPHGLANEGAGHYQQWLFTKGIKATGYVVNGQLNKVLNNRISVRQSLLNAIDDMPLSHPTGLLKQ